MRSGLGGLQGRGQRTAGLSGAAGGRRGGARVRAAPRLGPARHCGGHNRRRLILAVLCCLLLCAPVLAEDAQDELYDALDISGAEEALPDEAREILGDAGVDDAMEPEGMLQKLASAAWDKLGSLWRSAAAAAVKLVAVALLCSLATAFTDGTTERYVGLAGCLAVSAVAFTDAGSCIEAGVAAPPGGGCPRIEIRRFLP